MKKIDLIPRINKANGQVTFTLKKKSLPKDKKEKLCKLTKLVVDLEDFKWQQ